jgi:Amt family ammonium transporter
MLGGLGGVSFMAQLVGSLIGVGFAFVFGYIVYKVINSISSLRLDQESEYNGADISIHKITASPDIDR